jgi:hypothetical protein
MMPLAEEQLPQAPAEQAAQSEPGDPMKITPLVKSAVRTLAAAMVVYAETRRENLLGERQQALLR